MQYIIYLLAYTYGSGSYGNTTYQTSSTSGGILTNTGFDLLLIASLAGVLIFAALMIRLWKRPIKEQIPPASDNR